MPRKDENKITTRLLRAVKNIAPSKCGPPTKLPIEEKESFRWIEALRETNKRCSKVGLTVTVCPKAQKKFNRLMKKRKAEFNQDYWWKKGQPLPEF